MRFFLLAAAAAAASYSQTPSSEQVEQFEKHVRPVLAARCQSCHNAVNRAGDLDLSTAAGVQRGTGAGPVIIPGDSRNSRLLQVVSYEERIKMPPSGKLKEGELAALREWVEKGASWPESQPGREHREASRKTGYTQAQKEFWSFRPLRRSEPPAVRKQDWVLSPIDRFILQDLEKAGLDPAPPASRTVLIRRATLDLTGLPPTKEEVESFLADEEPGAFERVVDRLLASPHYGERWGRHWLDVARYADSTGADEDYRYPHAWRYRDYVIDAFNRDLPYNEFVREQVAGDLLPPPAGEDVNVRGIIATGFLALGPKLVAEQDKVKMFYDIVDEQIDVTGKAFLGLTIACARCHDHKFDPVSTKDYYSLASIFASTKQLDKLEGTVSTLYFAPLVPKNIAQVYEAHQKKIADKQKEIDDISASEARRFRDAHAPRMAAYMVAARKVYEGGASAGETAKAASLDETMLQRWVDYLKPTRERRAHLDDWYKASLSEAGAIAKKMQEEFIAEVARRAKLQAEWKINADAATARGEKPPPAPRFPAGENRFLTEVSAAKGPLGLPEKDPQKVFSAENQAKQARLREELQSLKDAAPPAPPFACAVAEGDPVEQKVFVRGNPDSPGDVVAKRFPTVLAGEEQPPIASGSGRLELGNWLASPKNALGARVMANRIWQGHFGEGLVRTPNNFGVTGELPSHPELLDWLAAEFIARGWSVKQMRKLIMLSSTYRMSSESTPEKRIKDPENRLLSRFSIRRLTVEEIRDSLLSLDGSLDLTMGGTLQSGEGTDNEFSDSRKSLHPDDSKRRTVYLPLRRSNLSTLFTLYDFGDATTSTESRSQTNVAPQALYMMNSKFVAARSLSLAEQLLKMDTADEHRIRQAWMRILGREPMTSEVRDSLEYLKRFPSGAAGEKPHSFAWASLCRTLIASNDFIYVY